MDGGDRLSELRAALRERLGPQRYELWLGDETELVLADRTLTIRCASQAEATWLRRRFGGELAKACATLWSEPLAIAFEVRPAGDAADNSASGATDFAPASRRDRRGVAKRQAVDEHRATPAALGAFADFQVGASNALAVQAAREAAHHPGRYSPLVITGASGCGKSHLVGLVAREARATGRRLRILQMSAEQFTTQFVEALRTRDLPGFRHKVRSVDLLILDDVQFLISKKASLAELVYSMDAISAHRGQVVLACDRPAADLQAQSPELAARIAGGLTAAIDPPELAVRRGIVRTLAARAGVRLDDAVVELVAQQVVGSGRLLAGALNRLAAAGEAEHGLFAACEQSAPPITAEFAAAELGEFCRQHSPQVRLGDIQRAVCEVFGVEPARLKSPSKHRAVAEPRMLAMWLARRYTRAALSEIGDFFGRRSHSTVLSAQKKIDAMIGRSSALHVVDRDCPVEEALRRVENAMRFG